MADSLQLNDADFGDINDQKLPRKESLYTQRPITITKYQSTTEIYVTKKEEM